MSAESNSRNQRRRRLSRNRDFALLWTGQVVSTLGSESTLVAFPLLTLAVTGSPAAAGLVGFMNTIPTLLLYLPAGVLVDRHDRRTIMLTSSLLGLVAIASLGILAAVERVTLAEILVVAFLQGAATIGYQLAEIGALPHVVKPDELDDAIALNEARAYTARLGGPPLGGVLFGIGRAVPFIVDAASYAVIAVNVMLLRSPLQTIPSELGRRPIDEIREGLRFLCQQTFLRTSALLISASNFCWSALVIILIVAAKAHGASAGLVGLMIGLIAIGGLIGSLAAPLVLRRTPPSVTVQGIFWASGVFFACVPLTPDPVLRGLLIALAAAAGPAWNALVVGTELRLTPDHLRGRVNAGGMLIGSGAMPLGALVGGLLSEHAGMNTAILVVAGLELLLGVLALRSRALRSAVALRRDGV